MEVTKKFGLNGFQLKILALIIMTMDHIHYFFGLIAPVPELFTMIGRIAAPIFVFMVANGFAHTHSRGKYLLRLYTGAVLMQLGNRVVNACFPLPNDAIVMNGIFGTMSAIVLTLLGVEAVRACVRTRRYGRAALAVAGLLALYASGLAAIPLFSAAPLAGQLLMIFVPMPFLVEGSILFVLLGVGMYYCRNSKKALAIFYTLTILAIVALNRFAVGAVTMGVFMWLALPFMLLYNGERGRGMKYLFYAYYPAHVYLFAIAVSLLAR